MNGYERVMNMIDGKQVDRIPVWPFVMAFSAKYAGIPYSKFCTSYKSLAKAQIKTVEDFNLDAIPVDSDSYREASACGAILRYPEDDLPILEKPAIVDKTKFDFKLPDISMSERLIDKVEGVRYIKEKYKGEKIVLGWIEAPIQSAATIYDLNNLMMDFYMDPNFVNELIEYSMELGIKFAKEQIAAGADVIGIGDAVASMVSPEVYEKFVYPYTMKLVKELKKDTNCKLKYHVCGDANHLLPYAAKMEFDIVNIDYKVDIKKAFEIFKGISCVKGNIDPVSVLMNGNEDSIRSAVNDILAEKDGKFILSPGCEVPKDTPYENLHALVNSVC